MRYEGKKITKRESPQQNSASLEKKKRRRREIYISRKLKEGGVAFRRTSSGYVRLRGI